MLDYEQKLSEHSSANPKSLYVLANGIRIFL